MFNYRASLTPNNNHTPNGSTLVRTDCRALAYHLNRLPTSGGLGFGSMMPLGQPRFNLTEMRKTIITPRGIQIHTVVDIPNPEGMQMIHQSPIRNETPSFRAPPLLNSMSMMNHNFMENLNLPNWPSQNITSIPGPVLNVEPLRTYCSNPPLHLSSNRILNNRHDVDNLLTTGLLSGSTSAMVPVKTEPDMVLFDDKVEAREETEDNPDADVDSDDGRTHSLPHQKHGPYTCPKCNMVFQISQSFASHVLGHYKHETAAERRRRHIAKYKKKGLQLTQSPHGLTVAHKSFKESSGGRGRKNSAIQGGREELAVVGNRGQHQEHPQFDLRKPKSSSLMIVRVKEEVDQ